MIFSELYSAYYNAVAAILSAILDGERSERALEEIARKHAFAESVLTVMPSLKEGKWQLVHPDMTTPLLHQPSMPLTNLQKRWLKAVLLDPRIRLFGVDTDQLGDVEPLFTGEDYLVYDKYGDGDPYGDEDYIARFRFLTEAVRERTPIRIRMRNKYGRTVYFKCLPLRLEYSEKDDKFRLITRGCHFMPTVKLSSILSCTPCNDGYPIGEDVCEPPYEEAVLRVTDERNALERVMLHFAHFEKRAEKLDGNRYLVRLRYATDDLNELVIRILSFGPMVEVIGPDSFRASVIAKLKSQMACGL